MQQPPTLLCYASTALRYEVATDVKRHGLDHSSTRHEGAILPVSAPGRADGDDLSWVIYNLIVSTDSFIRLDAFVLYDKMVGNN